jgi:hypothetical protein
LVVGLHNSWLGVVRKSCLRWGSTLHWQQRRVVHRGMQIPRLPKHAGAVWAIAMVKNEADIIEASILHLLEQGVDHVLVADNGSVDGTLDVLANLATSHPISIAIDDEQGYYQAHKMTMLASAARSAGADWVVPFDADEFWFAPGTNLATFLRDATGTRTEATIMNAFPTRDRPTLLGLSGRMRLDARPHILPKVATMPHPLLWIEQGNHAAVRPGWSTGGLRILHLPWRSREQFQRKLSQGAAAYKATRGLEGSGQHWRELGEQPYSELDDAWEALLDGAADSSLGWRPVGPFVDISPGQWRTWDPEGVIPSGIPVQRVDSSGAGRAATSDGQSTS